jgi:hypothetical protein
MRSRTGLSYKGALKLLRELLLTSYKEMRARWELNRCKMKSRVRDQNAAFKRIISEDEKKSSYSTHATTT